MRFTKAAVIEQICWSLRLAEWSRSRDRAKIDCLAAGDPPYPQSENRAVNTNDLSLTRLAHDARSQLGTAFDKPANYFKCRTDYGVAHKRAERNVIVTREINRVMKRSLPYYECKRSAFALDVLHGIGPSNWVDSQKWRPRPLEIADILIPTATLLTFDNLPFFGIYRATTAEELYRLTHAPHVDPGWKLDVADAAIKWAEEQTARMMGNSWQEYWAPERFAERLRENSGLYSADMVQTIDLLDFYYWDDAGDVEGWRRKIIFDAWGGYTAYGPTGQVPDKNFIGGRDQFVYDGGDRVYARSLGEIVHFQFADLSAKAPFRYHGVRSLGHMLYDVCHLQNRLRCAFSEAVFENLLMYMRVKSGDDAERALKIELANRGIIDESVSFLSPTERWQPDAQMAMLGLNEFKQVIQDNSSGSVQNQNWSRDRVEKTKFQVMAEVNAMQTIVSAALQQAYRYEVAEYEEIKRRFFIPNSRDGEVLQFRARCLKQGVPEKYMVADCWEVEPERIMGAGNKTMEMAIAQQLMEWRPAYAPEAQQIILRQSTLAITDDAALTATLVPESKTLSDAAHDAMLAFGSLMAGGEVQFKASANRVELAKTLLGEMGLKVMQLSQVAQTGAAPSVGEVLGLDNVHRHIEALIAQIAMDPAEKERATQFAGALSKLGNEVKTLAKAVQDDIASKNGDSGVDAETRAKIEAMLITAKAKAQNTATAHAQRTAQRQAQFEMQQKQREDEHNLEMRRELERQQVEDAATDIKTAAEIQRDAAKSAAEPKPKAPAK